MKKLTISSLIGLAGLVAALGLLGGGTVEAGKPQVAVCVNVGGTDIKQHGNLFLGTNGPDWLDCSGSGVGVRIIGLGGDDVLIGSDFADSIDGGRGDDDITGNDGDDFLRGGPGNDNPINGDGGADTIDGGPGRDDCHDAETVRNCEG